MTAAGGSTGSSRTRASRIHISKEGTRSSCTRLSVSHFPVALATRTYADTPGLTAQSGRKKGSKKDAKNSQSASEQSPILTSTSPGKKNRTFAQPVAIYR